VPVTAMPASRPPERTAAPPHAAALVQRLATALARRGVRYCQWKGRVRPDMPHRTGGDVDLLVDRRHAHAFAEVADALGFKLALAPAEGQVPGVVSYLGVEPDTDRLVHVHVHYHLVLGRLWTTHYRLPLEEVVLDSAVPHTPFPAPAPQFELLLLVLQGTLRHSVRDAVHQSALARRWATRTALDALELEVSRGALLGAIAHCVHEVDLAFFDRCRETLERACPLWRRLIVRRQLERRLRAHAHPRTMAGAARRLARLPRRVLGRGPTGGKHLVTGGTVVALVGADGAGKSTCARALTHWLGSELHVHWAHLGRPPRSLATLAAGALLKSVRWIEARVGMRHGPAGRYFELLRYLCTARDRHRAYRRARRAATAGGIAICERYPIRENRFLVGPSLAQRGRLDLTGPLAEFLRHRELAYYARMAPPDLIFVLRVAPDVAVARKRDEPADYVRRRAQRIWETDWSQSRGRIIDAGRPLAEVLADLRVRLWEAL